MSTAKKSIVAIVAFMVVVGVVLTVTLPWNELFNSKSKAELAASQKWDVIEDQHNKITKLLHVVDFNFDKHISLELCYDSQGNPYYVGEPDDKLDALLNKLVETYNSDPSTSNSIDISDIRYSLTDGITAATLSEDLNDPLHAFLIWCGTPADLVNRETGEAINTKQITNYIFVVDREALNDWKLSWE